MLEAIGRLIFRRRNVLFPALLGAALSLSPPRPFGEPWWDLIAVAGVALMMLGQALRIITIGLDYVKRGGKRKRIYADRLVTAGIYAHARNPMYVGNLMVVLGLFMLVGQPWSMAIATGFFVLAYASVVRAEERYLLERFGEEYLAYCAAAPRWLPRIGGIVRTVRAYRFDWRAVIVKEYGTITLTLLAMAGVAAWKTWRAGALDRSLPVYLAVTAIAAAFFVVARWLKKGREMKPRGPTLLHPKGEIASLTDHRAQIDDIDTAILHLLNRRATHVQGIYELKRLAGIERFDPQRTESIIQRLISLNCGPLTQVDVRRLYTDLLWHFANEFSRRSDNDARTGHVAEIVTLGERQAPSLTVGEASSLG